MPYCVNCGVSLDGTQRACPLCDTQVVHPKKPIDTESPTPYPQAVSLPKTVRKKYLVFVLTGVLTITSAVCLLLNFMTSGSGLWSLFVLFSSALFWLLFVLPLALKRTSPYLYVLIDALAIASYLFSLSVTLDSRGWFMEIVLPALGLGALLAVIMTAWLRKNRREWPDVCTFITVSFSLACLMVDFLLHIAADGAPGLGFSIVGVLCGASLVVFFSFISRHKRFRAWLTRKTHV